jgi:hypothetical protein
LLSLIGALRLRHAGVATSKHVASCILLNPFAAGSKPRPRLLLDLWAAQQPPGRLSRMLPGLKKAAGKAAVIGCLIATGFIAGHHW